MLHMMQCCCCCCCCAVSLALSRLSPPPVCFSSHHHPILLTHYAHVPACVLSNYLFTHTKHRSRAHLARRVQFSNPAAVLLCTRCLFYLPPSLPPSLPLSLWRWLSVGALDLFVCWGGGGVVMLEVAASQPRVASRERERYAKRWIEKCLALSWRYGTMLPAGGRILFTVASATSRGGGRGEFAPPRRNGS